MVVLAFMDPIFAFIGGTGVVKWGGGVLRCGYFKVRVRW